MSCKSENYLFISMKEKFLNSQTSLFLQILVGLMNPLKQDFYLI